MQSGLINKVAIKKELETVCSQQGAVYGEIKLFMTTSLR
jgi:hypothetical protein